MGLDSSRILDSLMIHALRSGGAGVLFDINRCDVQFILSCVNVILLGILVCWSLKDSMWLIGCSIRLNMGQ